MTALQRRQAVEHLKRRRFSERRACRLVGLSRSVAQYRLQGRNDGALRTELKSLAERYPRHGYPTLHVGRAAWWDRRRRDCSADFADLLERALLDNFTAPHNQSNRPFSNYTPLEDSRYRLGFAAYPPGNADDG